MQKMQVRSLGWEDPLEKEMTIHSSILAWEILWRKEPGELQSMVSQRVSHDSVTEHQQCVMICQVLLLSVDNPQTDRDDYRKGFLLEEYFLPNTRGGLTPFKPLSGLQETRVATREESGVLGFPSSRGLTPRGSLECNPEIPAFPGEEY